MICGEPYRANNWTQYLTDWRRRRGIVGAHETCVCELLGKLAREKASGQPELFGVALPANTTHQPTDTP